MIKEDITKIQEAIKQATAPRLVEARRLKKEEKRKSQEIENQRRLNETKLRSTGVVDLFIQLRDSKTLTLYDGFELMNGTPSPFKDGTELPYATPATVTFSDDHSRISINFDKHISGRFYTSKEDCPQFIDHSLNAQISAQGQLAINNKIVNNDLVEVVKQSILEQKGLV